MCLLSVDITVIVIIIKMQRNWPLSNLQDLDRKMNEESQA